MLHGVHNLLHAPAPGHNLAPDILRAGGCAHAPSRHRALQLRNHANQNPQCHAQQNQYEQNGQQHKHQQGCIGQSAQRSAADNASHCQPGYSNAGSQPASSSHNNRPTHLPD